jgi:hypothetical protein
LGNRQLPLLDVVEDFRRIFGELFGVLDIVKIGANHLSGLVAGLAFLKVRKNFLTFQFPTEHHSFFDRIDKLLF